MRKSLLFLVSMVVASPSMAATNILVNGSIESNFTGWTIGQVGGGSAPVVIPYGSASPYPGGAFGEAVLPNNVTSLSPDKVGTKMAYFSSDFANPHSISQIVNLVKGMTYNVGFDYYAPRNGINNQFDASLSFFVGNVAVGPTLTAGGTLIPAKTWTNFSSSIVAATSGPTKFEFQFRGLGKPAADFAVDRVYATAAAVPEPATWLMMIVGFGGIGFSMRRKKPARRVQFA